MHNVLQPLDGTTSPSTTCFEAFSVGPSQKGPFKKKKKTSVDQWMNELTVEKNENIVQA